MFNVSFLLLDDALSNGAISGVSGLSSSSSSRCRLSCNVSEFMVLGGGVIGKQESEQRVDSKQ